MSFTRRNIRIAVYMLIEKLLRWCINPYLRASLLRLLGAKIGKNVRVYEIQIINPVNGFRNLIISDNVHIGPGTTIDVTSRVIIKERTTIAPGVMILTHSDAGEDHKSVICRTYPRREADVVIGSSVWIGAGSIIQAGIEIGDRVVVGAGSLVNKDIPCDCLAFGVPARKIREILTPISQESYVKG
jgi:acetyltransferase-like isoleucine patch superfamily enzyme